LLQGWQAHEVTGEAKQWNGPGSEKSTKVNIRQKKKVSEPGGSTKKNDKKGRKGFSNIRWAREEATNKKGASRLVKFFSLRWARGKKKVPGLGDRIVH